MSVLGSQLEIDIDPEGEATIMPRHLGNTGTGCFKLHDHRYAETKYRKEGPANPPGPGLMMSMDKGDTQSEKEMAEGAHAADLASKYNYQNVPRKYIYIYIYIYTHTHIK